MTDTVDTSGIEVETNEAPIAPVKEDKPAPETVDEDEADEPSGEPGDEQKPKSRRARKIDRLMLELEQANKELAKFRTQPKTDSQPKQDSEPKIEDYSDAFEYLRAHGEWVADQKLQSYKDQVKQESDAKAKEAEDLERAKLTEVYDEKIEKVIQENPEFQSTFQSYMNAGLVTPQVEMAVLRSDMADQVSLHLSKYPNDMVALSKMNPLEAKIAVAKIEEFIINNPSQGKKTNAPAPINPIGKKSSPSQPDLLKSDDVGDWDAYVRKMKAPRNK